MLRVTYSPVIKLKSTDTPSEIALKRQQTIRKDMIPALPVSFERSDVFP
jgi:hypothetical protein